MPEAVRVDLYAGLGRGCTPGRLPGAPALEMCGLPPVKAAAPGVAGPGTSHAVRLLSPAPWNAGRARVEGLLPAPPGRLSPMFPESLGIEGLVAGTMVAALCDRDTSHPALVRMWMRPLRRAAHGGHGPAPHCACSIAIRNSPILPT